MPRVDRALATQIATFAVIGAGPTGVELAGAVAELARFTLHDEFRRIDPRRARIVLVDHTGAKSGRRRTSPLMYHEDGDAVAVVASKAGQPTNPAWFHNLTANPETTIQIGPEVREVRARVAGDEERERLWPEFVSFYPGYEFFRRHAGDRKIPIVILEPRRA